MNRIREAFQGGKALIAFITGGDPDVDTTMELVLALEEEGTDIVEIGIPFSDPIAEGIVIQRADARALAAGCTTDRLFDMVGELRKKTGIPLLFMTYMNPVLSYGIDRFMAKCADSGIDGVIVPDLPYEEKDELESICHRYGICLISMIAPTSGERVKKIAMEAEGFLYCVSSLGVTGVRHTINTSIAESIQVAKTVSSIPCAIGFGISSPEQAKDMAAVSDGVIIGSAFVSLVEKHGKASVGPVRELARKMKNAID